MELKAPGRTDFDNQGNPGTTSHYTSSDFGDPFHEDWPYW